MTGPAVGALCLLAAWAFWTIGDRHTPRLTVLLVLAGSALIAGTRLGGWARSGFATVDRLLGQVSGNLIGVVVAGVIGLLALYVLVVHLRNPAKIAGKTLAAAFVLPLAAVTIPGLVGSAVNSALSALTAGVGSAVTALF